MVTGNIVVQKSEDFAVRIVKLAKFLNYHHKEFVMSKQLLRSGTSIGANLNEAVFGASKTDFLNKVRISLKECGETRYWLRLLRKTDYLNAEQYTSIEADCMEIQRLLSSIAKTTSDNLSKGL